MQKLLLVIGVAVVLIHAEKPGLAGEPCDAGTLTGSYIISALGADEGVVSAYAGMISYDGRGSYKIRIHLAGPQAETHQEAGTYSHLGACEFEAVSSSGRSAHYFVSPDGDWFKYVMKSGGNMLGDARRITRDMLVQ